MGLDHSFADTRSYVAGKNRIEWLEGSNQVNFAGRHQDKELISPGCLNGKKVVVLFSGGAFATRVIINHKNAYSVNNVPENDSDRRP